MSYKSKVSRRCCDADPGSRPRRGRRGRARSHPVSCGNNCIDIFNHQFGSFHRPNFVLDVKQRSARVGQPVILFRTSNSDPAQDFSAEFDGTTSGFYAAGLVSPQVALHYGCDSSAIVSNGQQIKCAPGCG